MMFSEIDLSEYMFKDENGFWTCVSCAYKSNKVSNTRQHIESKHINVKYQCSVCNYSCPTKNALAKHCGRLHSNLKNVF